MRPNPVVSRIVASAPLLLAVIVVAAFAGAGFTDVLNAVAGAVMTAVMIASALAAGVAAGASFGAWAIVTAGPIETTILRALAAVDGAVPAVVPAVILMGMTGGLDAASAWIAYCVPALMFGARSALLTLGNGNAGGILDAVLGRGVARRTVLRRHALPLAVARAADTIGPVVGAATATAAVVEHLAGIPGTGALCADAVLHGNVGAATVALAGLIAVAVAIDAVAAGLAQGWLPRRGGM